MLKTFWWVRLQYIQSRDGKIGNSFFFNLDFLGTETFLDTDLSSIEY